MAKASLLVVDDEEDIRDLIKYNLTKEGYEVTTVETGEQALKEARNRLPDLIILDLMLPGVDGLEVCKILKASHETAHLPILMVSAKGEEADVVTGLL